MKSHISKSGSLLIALGLAYFASYANTSSANNRFIRNHSDSLPPVETKSPNSDYKPAFAGQTRIAGAKTNTPYTIDKIANKLGAPFAIVAMPDGRLMVTMKWEGFMEILDRNGTLVKKITGFPAVVNQSQGGL